MTWQKIYNKYKDTELMKEFMKYLGYPLPVNWLELCFNGEGNIKNIYGYLLVFAETKGERLDIMLWEQYNSECESHKNFKDEEYLLMGQAMLWCANKFFEVKK